MKRSKKLQKIADESLSRFEDDAFLSELKRRASHSGVAEGSQSKKRRLKLAFFSGSSAAVIAAAILLCVFLLPPAGPSGKFYMEENQKTIESSIESLNTDAKDIDFAHLEYAAIKKSYDTVYGDTLFYTLSYYDEEMLDEIFVTVVTNSAYTYQFKHEDYVCSAEIASHELRYHEDVSADGEIYFYKVLGEIQTRSETIYIDYEGVGFEPENRFLKQLSLLIRS